MLDDFWAPIIGVTAGGECYTSVGLPDTDLCWRE